MKSLLQLITSLIALPLIFISCADSPASNEKTAIEEKGTTFSRSIEALSIENLFRDSLALAGNVEAVVSYLEVPHSFATQDEPALIVVFRAHEKGQPDRILIEE